MLKVNADSKTIKWNIGTCCLFVLLLKLVIICFLKTFLPFILDKTISARATYGGGFLLN